MWAAGLRNMQIDAVRGLACVLLVAYHAIGSSPQNGMQIPVESWIHSLNESLGFIRMPLFTFLSGIVYAARPVEWASVGHFMRGKVLRLLLPLLFVGLLFVFLQTLTPGSHIKPPVENILRILIFPYAHFWYLQALFCIFTLIALLECAGALSTLKKALAITFLSCALFFFRNDFPSLFSVDRAVYLLPFFLSGLLIARFPDELYRPRSIIPALVMVAGAVVLSLLPLGLPNFALSLLRLSVGVAAALIIVSVTPASPALAWLGFYSYTIYLYHVFGTAGARIVLSRLLPDFPLLIFCASLAAGLILPVLVHHAFCKIPYLSRALLGVRAKDARQGPALLKKTREA